LHTYKHTQQEKVGGLVHLRNILWTRTG